MKKFLFLLLISLVFYGVIVSFHMKRPYMFDETQYSQGAEAVAKTGRPVIYYWTLNYRPWLVSIAHPTLFIHSLAAAYRWFGISNLTGYLFGVGNALLSLILMFSIIFALFGKNKKGLIVSALAGGLYLTNPLLVRGSIVIDIDNTVLMTTMLLFTWLFVKYCRRINIRNILLFASAFALCLWAKETTTPLLIPGVFLYLFLSEPKFKKKLWMGWFSIFALGATMFLATWWIYCRVLSLPFMFPFEYTMFARTRSFLTASLYSRIATIRNDVFWLTPFFALLGIFSVFDRVKAFLKRGTAEALDFIAILGAGITVFYTLVMPTTVIPKYIVLLVPFYSILIASFLYETLSKLKLDRRLLVFSSAAVVILLIYYLKLIPDPLLLLLNRGSAYGKILLPLAYVGPLFFLMAAVKKISRLKWLYAAVISSLILLVPASVSLNLKQARADYATFYHYGERGLSDTIRYVKKNITEDKILFGRKEFEYYLPQHRVYFDRTGLTTILQGLLDDNKISYAVFSDYYEGDKEIAKKLDRTYPRVYQSGNFSVHKVEE